MLLNKAREYTGLAVYSRAAGLLSVCHESFDTAEGIGF
jgi:hypothetical protein